MKRVFYGVIILVSLVSTGVLAQPGWNWCEDKATAEEKNVLYTDALKLKDYQGSLKSLMWLINDCPGLNKSLYMNGSKIYEALADAEKDAAKKAVYVDSAMWMYDMRMEHFGDEANVMSRKALKAYKYNFRNFDKAPWLLEMYDKAFEIAGNKVMYQNLGAYMNVIKINKKAKKNLTDEQVLERYDKIIGIADFQIAAGGKYVPKVEQQKELVNSILVDIVVIDCEFVKNNMAPKFEENPEDIKLIKQMFRFMLTGKCTKDPLFLSVAKQLQKLQPDASLAGTIASISMGNRDFETANLYFNEALGLTEDKKKQAEIYLKMGKLKAVGMERVAARNYFRKAISLDPTLKEAYELIGDLYVGSYNLCKQEKSMVQDRLIFIAAYKMYQRAGATKKMAEYKAQFPSVEEIFNYGNKKGDAMTVGCWINEAVVLATRD